MEDETVPQRFDVRLCVFFFFFIFNRSVWIQMEVNSFEQFKLTCGTQERTSDQY